MINAGESVQVFSTIIGGESKEWRNGFVFHSYEDKMYIFFVKLQIRRNGEDYTQITPFLAEDKAVERFQQVLDVAKMFDIFNESQSLTGSLIRHWSSKYASIKLYKIKEGESKKLK